MTAIFLGLNVLKHWGLVMHTLTNWVICVSGKAMATVMQQAVAWTHTN